MKFVVKNGLTTRARNCIWSEAGIDAWESPRQAAEWLFKIPYDDLLRHPNVGLKTMAEFREFLESFGLKPEWPRHPREPVPKLEKVEKDLEKLLRYITATLIGLTSYVTKELAKMKECNERRDDPPGR